LCFALATQWGRTTHYKDTKRTKKKPSEEEGVHAGDLALD
jgi:hypothetical protein